MTTNKIDLKTLRAQVIIAKAQGAYCVELGPTTLEALLDRLEAAERRDAEFDALDKLHRNLVGEHNQLRDQLAQVTRELQQERQKNAKP